MSHLLYPQSEEEVLSLFAANMPRDLNRRYENFARKYGGFNFYDITDRRREPTILKHTQIEEFIEEFLEGFPKDSLETRDGSFIQNQCELVVPQLTRVHPHPVADILFEIRIDDEPYLSLVEFKSGCTWGNKTSRGKTHEDLQQYSARLSQEYNMPCIPIVAHFSTNNANHPNKEIKDNVLQLHGQESWRWVTGHPNIYRQFFRLMGALVEPWRLIISQLKEAKKRQMLPLLEHYQGTEGVDAFFRDYKPTPELGSFTETLQLAREVAN